MAGSTALCGILVGAAQGVGASLIPVNTWRPYGPWIWGASGVFSALAVMLTVAGARREKMHEGSDADAPTIRVENQFADESRQISSNVYIENLTRQERQDRSLFAVSLEPGSGARLVVGNIPGTLANQIETTNNAKVKTAFQISASPLVLFGIRAPGRRSWPRQSLENVWLNGSASPAGLTALSGIWSSPAWLWRPRGWP